MEAFDWGEPISVYTRAQAIEDGVLVPVDDLAREAGFLIPVVMTASVDALCGSHGRPYADYRGRQWDVLYLAAYAWKRALRANSAPHEARFVVRMGARNETLVLAFNAYEGFTIMLPGED